MNKFVVYFHNELTNELISHGEDLTMPEALKLRDSHSVGLEIMSQTSWDEMGETFVVYRVLNDGTLLRMAAYSTSAGARSLIKSRTKHEDYTDCLIMKGSDWDKLKNYHETSDHKKIAA